jgi:hypothetical protein
VDTSKSSRRFAASGSRPSSGRRLPWANEIPDIRRPVDNRLFGTSSWINFLTKRSQRA